MKKILFIANLDSFFIKFLIPQLKYFKDLGYIIHVASKSENIDVPYCDKKINIPFARSFNIKDNIKSYLETKKLINKENYDIVYCHTPFGGAIGRLAAKRARKKGTKVIYMAHGFHFYKGAPILKHFLFYNAEKYFAKLTDLIITINKEDYNIAKKKFKTKIEYINGVGLDIKKFNFNMSQEEKQKLRKSLGLKPNNFVLIYPAELNKNKNQIWLLKTLSITFKKNRNIHLLLPGNDRLKGKLNKLSKKLDIQDNIHFLGFRKDVPRLLKISDLAVSSSKREGLPVNIMEAIYAGLPVVATECRGNRDLIINGKNGYIVKLNDSKEFVSKTIEYYNGYDKTRISEISNKIICNYILNNIILQLDKIFKKYLVIRKQNIQLSTQLRILHFVRKMDVGGAETFIMNVYRNIDREKIQFDFFVSDNGYYDDEIKKLGGKIFYMPYLTDIGQIKYIKQLTTFFKEHIYYRSIHSHIDQVSGIIVETAKKCGIDNIISHSHSTKNSNGVVAKIYKKYLQSKITKNANSLLACSEEAAKWLFGKDYKKAIIVKNGIDINKYKFSQTKREKIRKELDICKDTILIGHVGSFSKVKNHEFIIDVFNEYIKLNTNSVLVLVGEGKLYNKIKEKVKRLKIEEKVKFLGVRSDADYLYSSFDIFIFPSLYEGLSLALIEAQTSGLNIIASDKIDKLTDITSTIKYKNIDESPKEWAKTMTLFKSKRYNNIKKISTAGYNIVDTVEKLLKIYYNNK